MLLETTDRVPSDANHQRIMVQLEQTDALLNKYSNILDKSEAVTRLIFDERWEGAEVVRILAISFLTFPNNLNML